MLKLKKKACYLVKTHKAPGGIKFARGEGLKQIKTLTC